MAQQTFSLASFRASFPELATVTDQQVEDYWNDATVFLGSYDGCLLNGAPMARALNLLAAHLVRLATGQSAGQGVSGPVTGATQGSVSVQLLAPPAKDGWQFWLASTPYGMQLWALLNVQAAGGLMVGGSLERASFRKAGGVF